jgi:hypothetical protein
MGARSGIASSEKLNARIQFFGYTNARSTRRPLKRPEKLESARRPQVERQLPKWIFSVSAFSGEHSRRLEVSVIVLRFLFALAKFLADGRV